MLDTILPSESLELLTGERRSIVSHDHLRKSMVSKYNSQSLNGLLGRNR